ncbi:MAG: cell division protein FtsN [Idiomarina sp. 34-48-12]|nr:MAG: cell division protein FtsN [Idiomarina sp. 34-48-12]
MDYANRKRPAKRPPPKAKKKAAKKPAVSWWVVLLAIVLVGGFVWALVSISGKSEQAPQQQVPIDVPETQSQPVAEPIPDKPEERWQYIEELENQEVIVDVPEREVGPPKLMQCGSFRNINDAEEMRATIAMIGLEAQIRTTDGSNGVWHRVILGPYEGRRAAETDRHKLQRGNIRGCQIWNWN